MKPIIVIGSGHAGLTLTRELRVINKEVSIILITQDDGCSYYKPNLSKAISVGKSANDLVMKNVEQIKTEQDVFIKTHTKVVAIDAKKNGDKWEVFTHGGRNNSGIDALEYAEQMEKNGAGELLVTSMDRDGTQVGYDIDLMSKISSKVNIPVIASGGVGNLDHLVDGIKLGKASAVLAASIFHYGKHSVKEAKDYLDSKGIPVRI